MSIKNLKQKKIEIRSKHKKLRNNMDPEQKSVLDKALTQNFITNPHYLDSDVIFAFISKDIEVDTRGIIEDAWAKGKRVCVPRCNTEEKLMDYYYINSYDDLLTGAYGLQEPDISKCQKVEDLSKGICIVPGLVYDREGYRLGFGKGYYDRFLINFQGITIGVCYSRCVEPSLPRGYYDRPIDFVITEKYTVDTRNI